MKTIECVKSRQQIADEYGIDYKTLMRRIKKNNIEIPSGSVFKVDQKKIYEALGYPNPTVKKQFDTI
jgi:hypothetical protein